MYTPDAFEMRDPAKIGEVIAENGFAALISKDGDSLFASHLPFLHHPGGGKNGRLASHMARANRHWQLFDGGEVLVVFQGPHAYISPSCYVAEVAVPTWNYATVHVYGIPRLMETEAELIAVLDETVQKYEGGRAAPWKPNLPADLQAKLHGAIVGFEVDITRIEAKFKLGQNRSREDQMKMIRSLRSSGKVESIRLADLIERELETKG
jgi:transcriptional regulator